MILKKHFLNYVNENDSGYLQVMRDLVNRSTICAITDDFLWAKDGDREHPMDKENEK